jgi:serine/threonine protein kinase
MAHHEAAKQNRGKNTLNVDWKPGRELLGQYRVVKKLGQGGMGAVYLVENKRDISIRYAVKTLLPSHTKNHQKRRSILQEMCTWFDLPEHPNITTCRFFRTIEGQISIFADYVNGGSLHDWIHGGRITTLEQILTIAIQSAWGLQIAHDRGVIHQDIKPANILMTEEAVPRITDFGLARTRHRALPAQPIDLPGGETVMVSSSGMTIAYCSPEQVLGEKLSRRTDQWSWALTVLEMILNGRSWKIGAIAMDLLQSITNDPARCPITPFPHELLSVLERAFQKDPADRWPSMNAAVERLQEIYSDRFEETFPILEPDTPTPVPQKKLVRRTPDGEGWPDPEEWLRKALSDAGRPEEDLQTYLIEQRGSWRAQILVDLELYDEILKLYRDLETSGHMDTSKQRARVLQSKALILSLFTDTGGFLTAIDETIRIVSSLLETHPELDIVLALADAHNRKAKELYMQRQHAAADSEWSEAIDLLESWSQPDRLPEKYYHFITTFLTNRGITQAILGQVDMSLKLMERSIELLEILVMEYPKDEHYHKQAVSVYNYANLLIQLNKHSEGMAQLDQTLAISKKIQSSEFNTRMAIQQSLVYERKANTYVLLGENSAALQHFDRAISIIQRLIKEEKIDSLRFELARIFVNKTSVLNMLNRMEETIELCGRAIEIYEDLVRNEGQEKYIFELGVAYRKKANALNSLNQHDQAELFAARALKNYKDLAPESMSVSVREHIAHTYHTRGLTRWYGSRYQDAAEDFDEAIDRWQALFRETEIPLFRSQEMISRIRRFFTMQDGDMLTNIQDAAQILYVEIQNVVENSGNVHLKEEMEEFEERFPFVKCPK